MFKDLFLLQFLSSLLQFSKCRSFTSLVKCIPRFFFFLGTIVNGIVFLFSLSAILLCIKMQSIFNVNFVPYYFNELICGF